MPTEVGTAAFRGSCGRKPAERGPAGDAISGPQTFAAAVGPRGGEIPLGESGASPAQVGPQVRETPHLGLGGQGAGLNGGPQTTSPGASEPDLFGSRVFADGFS